jgi:putative aldouronate transport system permease protein
MNQTKARKGDGMKKQLPLLVISLPGLVYLFINNYLPMMGIFIAFKKIDYSKGIFKSPWTGFSNFKFLFQTNDAFVMIRNTVLYNLCFIILGTICAVFIAILMVEVSKLFFSRIFQAGLILPNLVSMVVVAYLVYAFLTPETGLMNKTLLPLLGAGEINWYSEAKYWPFILVTVQLWKTAGYSSIVYIANIAGIDQGLYEAAVIDGAGKLRQIFHITIPLLKPTIIIMVLMSIGRIFASDFGLFYQVPMNSGALFSVTQTIDTYVYRGLMQRGDIGMSSAAGLFQSVIGFALVMGANAVVRKVSSENALF